MNRKTLSIVSMCMLSSVIAAAVLAQAPAPAAPSSSEATPSADPRAAQLMSDLQKELPPSRELTAQQAGYLLGLELGERLQSAGLTKSSRAAVIDKGIRDGLQGKKSTFAERLRADEYIEAATRIQVARNLKEAQDFLKTNAGKPGVVTTSSGLQYKVIRPGDPNAPAPKLDDVVLFKYRGTLLDGTEFYSSEKRKQPSVLIPKDTIPAWREGITLMRPGAQYVFYAPPNLAYGETPHGRKVPGNSLVIFEVELLSSKPVNPDVSANFKVPVR